MNERIKELAEQAGIKFSKDWGECYTGNVQLERFAELVRQDEREACADLVFEMLQHKEFDQHWVALHKANMAIRARSKHD